MILISFRMHIKVDMILLSQSINRLDMPQKSKPHQRQHLHFRHFYSAFFESKLSKMRLNIGLERILFLL